MNATARNQMIDVLERQAVAMKCLAETMLTLLDTLRDDEPDPSAPPPDAGRTLPLPVPVPEMTGPAVFRAKVHAAEAAGDAPAVIIPPVGASGIIGDKPASAP